MLTVEDSWSWRLKIIEVDGWRSLKLTVWRFLKLAVLQGDMNCENMLTGFQAFMRHATCHFLIGFCTRSKHRFVFRASHIYNTLLLPHFSTFQLKHIVRAPSSTLSESFPSNICTRHLYNRRPSVTQTRWVLLFCTSPAFVLSFSYTFIHTRHRS